MGHYCVWNLNRGLLGHWATQIANSNRSGKSESANREKKVAHEKDPVYHPYTNTTQITHKYQPNMTQIHKYHLNKALIHNPNWPKMAQNGPKQPNMPLKLSELFRQMVQIRKRIPTLN